MANLNEAYASKWINAFLVLAAALVAYLVNASVLQLSDWLDLEAKISHFTLVRHSFSILMAVTVFVIAKTHSKSSTFLNQVYLELTKVVWPEQQSITRMTFGILIAVLITGFILVLVDLGIRELINLFYKLFDWIF